MILQVSNGRVEFAGEELFSRVDFVIKNKNEKIAVVGRNGCGKTTLLKVLGGEIEMTQHESDAPSLISKTGNPSIGYLKQISFSDEELTLDEEIRKVFARVLAMKKRLDTLVREMSEPVADEAAHAALIEEYTSLQETFQDIGGYYYEKEYDAMLRSFGFTQEDKNKRLSAFSGGQRTKLAFIKLLLSKPEILLLDEPTNHLDITAIEWLEGFLQNYPYALVVVSHDRMFLDRIVSTVYEIEHGTAKRYSGNYTDFMRQKRENYEKQKKDYQRQQAEIKRLTELAEKMKHHPTKVSMAHSKEKAVAHMVRIEAPDEYDNRAFHAAFIPKCEPGRDILSVRNLVIGYSADHPLCSVSFEVKRGDRLGIIGGNGLGKSTLLKTLVGNLQPLAGEFHYGVNVEIGYFDQEMARYSSDKTVLDDFWDAYPTLVQTEVRSALGAFLFTQDEVFKSVNMLSGGERVRLALAKIFQAKPNVLILDEPTNHMDMIGKEALEQMLHRYTGTVIFVSHDRYFIRQISEQVLEIGADPNAETGALATLYPFGYEDDLERTGRSGLAERGDAEKSGTQAQLSYHAGKELARRRKKLAATEEALLQAEEELQRCKDEMMNPAYASDYVKLRELQEAIDRKDEEILTLMEAYEALDNEIASFAERGEA